MTVTIRVGDCRNLLEAMPDESVNCVVTSPPYWGLRDYGVVGQIGMERTLGEHLEILVGVFNEVRRVLRKDGTCWVNYGDCYATTPNGRGAVDAKAAGGDDRTFRDKPFSTIGPIIQHEERHANRGTGKEGYRPVSTGRVVAGGLLKAKDLCMVANRLAIALQDSGWWVRSEIIWSKPNPMPESVTDRPACQHEKIFMLTKSQKYWYDAEAVRRPMAEVSVSRLGQDLENQKGSARANGGKKTNGKMKAVGKVDKQRGHSRRHAGFIARWDAVPKDEQTASAHLRNVWTIPTAAFSEAHFATFPPALVEPCVKAGCPTGGIVLDPFGGAGTVGLVADRLGRDALMFELNPAYAEIARKRLLNDGGMFIDVQMTPHLVK